MSGAPSGYNIGVANGNTCQIWGTPQDGNYQITVYASNSVGQSQYTYSTQHIDAYDQWLHGDPWNWYAVGNNPNASNKPGTGMAYSPVSTTTADWDGDGHSMKLNTNYLTTGSNTGEVDLNINGNLVYGATYTYWCAASSTTTSISDIGVGADGSGWSSNKPNGTNNSWIAVSRTFVYNGTAILQAHATNTAKTSIHEWELDHCYVTR
jgi:hypothetical protein